MRVVVAYDISDDRIRTKVVGLLEGLLTRVQYSVFEGEVPEDLLHDRVRLAASLIDTKKDSIRVYRLCASCLGRLKTYGREVSVEPEEIRVL